MKCPECGLDLHQVSIIGIDDSFRCGNCGSVRIQGWVINRIAEGGELKIVPMGKSSGKVVPGRSLACPEDGAWLTMSSGGELPPDVPVWQCGKCKWWWVPGDNIFDVEHAFDVKREYNRRWKKGNPISGFALPVVLTMVLTIGLGVAVMAVRDQFVIQTEAVSLVGKVVVIYNEGKAEIRFVNKGNLGMVAYKREKDVEWQQASIVNQGEWSLIVIESVRPGEKIWLSFGQQVKQVTVGKEL
jgi:hypothetical protein